MKSVITVLAFVLLVSSSFAQPRIEQGGTNPPRLPQEGKEGWHKQVSNTLENLKRVQFFSRTNGWICGQEGNAYRTTDGGKNWIKVPHPPDYYYVYFQNDSTGFAIGEVPGPLQESIVKTTNRGLTWSDPANYRHAAWGFIDMTHVGNDTLFILSNSGAVSRTIDGGKNWVRTPTDLSYTNSISFSDSKHGYIVGDKIMNDIVPKEFGGFAYTTDGGNVWIDKVSGIEFGFSDVFAINNKAIAIAHPELIFETSNFGESWDTANYQITENGYSAITFSDIVNGTIVGAPGLIKRTTDGGKTWISQHSTVQYPQDTNAIIFLRSVSFVDSLYGWSAGSDGTILHTKDAGKTWVKQTIDQHLPITSQVFPEPSVGNATIRYFLPQPQYVTLLLHSESGQLVKEVFRDTYQTSGEQNVSLNLITLPQGRYYFTLTSSKFNSTGSITIIR